MIEEFDSLIFILILFFRREFINKESPGLYLPTYDNVIISKL